MFNIYGFIFVFRMTANIHVICHCCSKPFSDPRILPCLHSFCCQCLYQEIKIIGSQQSIQCPICQRSVTVSGVSSLLRNLHLEYEVEIAAYMSKIVSSHEIPCNFCANGCRNFAVVFCCSCRRFLCKTGHDCHQFVPQLLEHTVLLLVKETAMLLPTIMKPTEHYCSQPQHKNQVLDFYCNTCNCPICRDCIRTVHKDHNYTLLSTIAEAHRDELKGTLQCAQGFVSVLADAINANKKVMQQVETSKEEAESTIIQTFKCLMETLEERKKALLSELEITSLSKTTALNLQKEQFEKLQQDISHYTKMTSNILQTHTDHEIVALGDLVPTELKATLKKGEHLSLFPNQRSYLTVSVKAQSDLLKQLSQLGCIVDLYPDPRESKCIFEPVARVNTMYYIKVETKTLGGVIYPCGGLEMKAKLRSKKLDVPDVLGRMEDHGNGTYTLALNLQTAGPQQLHITMDGQHVQNSPYDLILKGDYTSVYSSQDVISVSGKPLCVAVHENGDIYVGSNDKHIYVFDQAGGHLKNTIDGRGLFKCPVSIFIKEDVMYIADLGNHCILKLTTRGEFVVKFGGKGSGQGQFIRPLAVVVNSKDNVIVADRDNNRVQVFNQDGSWRLTIDGIGSDSVKVFTPDSAYIRTYGNVKSPYGLVVDAKGYSLVSAYDGNCLCIFDPQGHKIHTVENLRPNGIALDPERCNIYVSSLDGMIVSKYTYTCTIGH